MSEWINGRHDYKTETLYFKLNKSEEKKIVSEVKLKYGFLLVAEN